MALFPAFPPRVCLLPGADRGRLLRTWEGGIDAPCLIWSGAEVEARNARLAAAMRRLAPSIKAAGKLADERIPYLEQVQFIGGRFHASRNS